MSGALICSAPKRYGPAVTGAGWDYIILDKDLSRCGSVKAHHEGYTERSLHTPHTWVTTG